MTPAGMSRVRRQSALESEPVTERKRPPAAKACLHLWRERVPPAADPSVGLMTDHQKMVRTGENRLEIDGLLMGFGVVDRHP